MMFLVILKYIKIHRIIKKETNAFLKILEESVIKQIC